MKTEPTTENDKTAVRCTGWLAEFAKMGLSYCDGWVAVWNLHRCSSPLAYVQEIQGKNNEHAKRPKRPQDIDDSMEAGWRARDEHSANDLNSATGSAEKPLTGRGA